VRWAQVTEIAETTFGVDQLGRLSYGTQDFSLHKAYLTGTRAAYLHRWRLYRGVGFRTGRLEGLALRFTHRLLDRNSRFCI